jgi:hypothetical protein
VRLIILACLPCMVTLRSPEAPYSYANFSKAEECYESVFGSSKILTQTRLTP